MSRPIWKGTISFGMVSIPVALHPGESADELSFDLLDRRDRAPIGYRKVNKNTGEEVPREEIVRAYRVDGGRYVVVEDADLTRISEDRLQTIRIHSFASPEEIRPVYFERPYYLEAAERVPKGYALLREALVTTHRVGVAQVVLRTRERLAVLTPEGPLLVLNLVRYAHELRDPAQLRIPRGDAQASGLGEKELKMAQRLVEEMTEPWAPEKFRDVYREEVLAALRRKAESGAVEAAPSARRARERAPAGDLMTLLKKSVHRAEESRPRRSRTA
jgi:DNA end-binding protein Ku